MEDGHLQTQHFRLAELTRPIDGANEQCRHGRTHRVSSRFAVRTHRIDVKNRPGKVYRGARLNQRNN